MESPVYVSLEFTPNPNTLKYTVNRTLLEKGALNFNSLDEAEKLSPLAQTLFQIEGISAVMLGRDFVTITKAESGDWEKVHQGAASSIEKHLTEKKPILSEEAQAGQKNENLTQTEKRIIEILEAEIRPAVAMDGGEITFDRFDGGVVYLHLQGSCAGCPSSTITLKQGIEARLQRELPEVKEVVSV